MVVIVNIVAFRKQNKLKKIWTKKEQNRQWIFLKARQGRLPNDLTIQADLRNGNNEDF